MMDGFVVDFAHNEQARLNALRNLNLLDTSPSENFDRLTRLASRLFNAPVSTISLTEQDRQWFKSKVGVDITEIPREQAPCSYAIEGNDVFVVSDLSADPRFIDSPLVNAGIRFYAGAPLFTKQGHGLGTLCVVDDKVRELDNADRQVLRDLAGMVMAQVELQNTIGRVDANTGLANQYALLEHLEELASREADEAISAFLLEIASQDQTGHGQRVLGASFTNALMQGAVAQLRSLVGNSATLYQVAPTRCVLLLSSNFGGDIPKLTSDILSLLELPIECNGIPVLPKPSLGRYSFTSGRVAPQDVLRRLFNALEDSIASDGEEIDYSARRDDEHARSFTLINDFKAALDNPEQLSLHYQPRIDLVSGACIGAEALLRWTHPVLGPIPPFDFIPAVEETALVRPLTEWVIRAAAMQAVAWEARGISLKVSLNISARNLDEHDFAQRALAIIRASHAKPSQLEFEFTESAVARNAARVVEQLNALRDAGIVIAIDDFGSGYSNLSYLQSLPASVLKIDRAFIRSLETSERDRTLVRSILSMGHDLHYRVVAEGIETQVTYDMLRLWGCNEAQGFFMSRPVRAHVLEEWLSAGRERSAG